MKHIEEGQVASDEKSGPEPAITVDDLSQFLIQYRSLCDVPPHDAEELARRMNNLRTSLDVLPGELNCQLALTLRIADLARHAAGRQRQ